MISDGKARRIASEWHGGMFSALYSFSSTGMISSETKREVLNELTPSAYDPELCELLDYLQEVEDRGPVENWHMNWE